MLLIAGLDLEDGLSAVAVVVVEGRPDAGDSEDDGFPQPGGGLETPAVVGAGFPHPGGGLATPTAAGAATGAALDAAAAAAVVLLAGIFCGVVVFFCGACFC